MRPKKRLNLLFTCAISLVLLAFLIAILAKGFFDISNITVLFVALYSALIFGLLEPGFLILLGLQHFFDLSFKNELALFIAIVTSIIPWIILGFSILAKQEKWIVFVGLFILMYILCGGLYAVLELVDDVI
jgi:hypothetical protein